MILELKRKRYNGRLYYSDEYFFQHENDEDLWEERAQGTKYASASLAELQIMRAEWEKKLQKVKKQAKNQRRGLKKQVELLESRHSSRRPNLKEKIAANPEDFLDRWLSMKAYDKETAEELKELKAYLGEEIELETIFTDEYFQEILKTPGVAEKYRNLHLRNLLGKTGSEAGEEDRIKEWATPEVIVLTENVPETDGRRALALPVKDLYRIPLVMLPHWGDIHTAVSAAGTCRNAVKAEGLTMMELETARVLYGDGENLTFPQAVEMAKNIERN